MEKEQTPTELLVIINQKKKEHESIKREMLQILDNICESENRYNKLLEKLNAVEIDYVTAVSELANKQ